jgi:pyridoxine 4-dehydrogenase
MTDAIQRTDPAVPPPGGTAGLAGRPVARIGFGVMQLERAAVDRDTALAVLRQAAGAGVNHIDTAQFYSHCNELIRAALAPYDDALVLVSKVGAVRDADGKLVPGQRPAELRAQLEANLTALGTAGKIGGIGLSSVTASQLRQALPAGIACVQNGYSVLDRTAEPVLDLCREHGVAWVPFFPLGSAFPGRPKAGDDPAVCAIAAELGATPGQVALAWLLASYDKTLLIPGTADPAHLAENLAAGAVKLPADALDALDRLAPAPDGDQP